MDCRAIQNNNNKNNDNTEGVPVVAVELGLFGRDGTEHVVLGASLLVNHKGVAVRKGAAAHILSRQTHQIALVEERSVCEQLSRGPIKWLVLGEHLAPRLQQLGYVDVRREAGGQFAQLESNLLELGERHARVLDACQLIGPLEALPVR